MDVAEELSRKKNIQGTPERHVDVTEPHCGCQSFCSWSRLVPPPLLQPHVHLPTPLPSRSSGMWSDLTAP